VAWTILTPIQIDQDELIEESVKIKKKGCKAVTIVGIFSPLDKTEVRKHCMSDTICLLSPKSPPGDVVKKREPKQFFPRTWSSVQFVCSRDGRIALAQLIESLL